MISWSLCHPRASIIDMVFYYVDYDDNDDYNDNDDNDNITYGNYNSPNKF